MSQPPRVPEGPPLAASTGEPALYGVLGAVLHLEILKPDDEERLARAMDRVAAWLGPELRWTNLSCDEWVSPFRTTDLEYVSCYCRALAEPPAPTPETALLTSNLVKMTRIDHEVACKGGDSAADASPYLVRFCAEIPEVGRGPLFEPYSVLTVSVPEAWPLADFRAQILGIASELRLRWGTAGYTYAAWELQDFTVPRERVFGHARRYPGYDVGYFAADTRVWYNEVRSVSWLTFLGTEMTSRLVAAGRKPVSDSLLHISEGPNGWCIQAGATPERGDVNRIGYPRAYVEADTFIRPIRSPDGKPFVFMGRWTESSITDWIRRFERRVM